MSVGCLADGTKTRPRFEERVWKVSAEVRVAAASSREVVKSIVGLEIKVVGSCEGLFGRSTRDFDTRHSEDQADRRKGERVVADSKEGRM